MGEPGDLKHNGVNVILQNSKGEYLFARHNYGAKKWSLPGGGIKKGELANRAIVRETKEETGLDIIGPPVLIAVIQLVINHEHQVLLFKASNWDGIIRADGNEISEIKFMKSEDIKDNMDIYPAQQKFVQIFEVSYLKLPLPVFALASNPPTIEW